MPARFFRVYIIALVGVFALGTSMPSKAQGFPSRPVRLVVPFAAGGGTDLIGRVVADSLAKELGQPVFVENRPGAGTAIGSDAVARSTPDGYTLLLNGSSMAYLRAFVAKVPFDTERDFRRVSQVSEQPFVLTVSNHLPVKNLAEFITLAKAKPETLNYVSAGIGSTTHMESELLWREMGVKLVHVPYKGTGPAVADLLAGHVDVMYTTLAAAAELVRTQKVKALAISSSSRNPLFPDVPTVGEGLGSKFHQASTQSLFVPAATPLPIAERLFEATGAALKNPTLVARFGEQGLTVVPSHSLTESDARQHAEIAGWTEITRSLGIKAE